MKLKRFACGALAAVMSFSLLVGPGGFVRPAQADAPDDDLLVSTFAAVPDTTYDTLRGKWREYLLGGTGTDLDPDNPGVKIYLDSLNKDANTYWDKLIKSSTVTDGNYNNKVFPGLDMTPAGAKDASDAAKAKVVNMVTTLRRLVTLAKAYSTDGCTLYQNETVLAEIISATDYVVNHIFAKDGVKYTNQTTYGNWYEWDISGPTALGNITMLLYDKLTADQVTLYAETIKYYAGNGDCSVSGPNSSCTTKMTGANLLLKAYNVAVAGILLKEADLLENVRTNVKSTVSAYNDPKMLFETDAKGDGFYADGSYIQHYALPYVAGYGEDLFNNFSVFFRMFKGTPWEIGYAGNEDPLIFNFIFDGVEPFIAGGRTMDMVAGRDIARGNRNDRVRTATFLNALLGMRGTFPSDEQNQRFDSMVKYYLSQDFDFYCSNMSSIVSIQAASAIMSDTSIKARSSYNLTKVFAMDRAVHHTDSFALGIAMQSTRTFAYEIIINQGFQSWNIANGMVFLYDGDKNQYSDGYWCTVDPLRLPGTTAEHTAITDKVNSSGNGGNNANIYDWTGGSVLGSNGVAGMHMKALSKNDVTEMYKSGPRTGADMKKSYFMFGDRILMLGSSITSTTGTNVETTVENRKIDGSNVVTVGGKTTSLSTNSAKPTTLTNPKWLHIAGNVAGSDVGYYFPENITLQAIKETRTGKWTDQGTQVSGVTTENVTNTYATFYVDHGVKPTDAGYAYVLLPGKTAAETAAYADAPDIEILQNDGAIHAARDTKQGIFAANFWEAGTVGGVSVNAPASVIMKTEGDTVTVGVSDPTQKDVPITVTLGMVGEVTKKDSTVTVNEDSVLMSFTVNTTGSLGQTHELTFKVTGEVGTELMGIVSAFSTPIEVDFGTPFYELYDRLPATAEFSASDGKKYELELDWRRGTYTATELGEFTIEGWPVLPGGLSNSAGVYAPLTVKTRGDATVLASANAWTQKSTPGETHASGNVMNVGKGNETTNAENAKYTRYTYIQFNLADIPAGTSHKLAFTAYDYKDSRPVVDVDLTYDNITISGITWNNAPENCWTDAASPFTINDTGVIVGEEETYTSGSNTRHRVVLNIDVTDAVEQAIVNAKKENKTTITFRIGVTNYETFIIYSKDSQDANNKRSPAIISEPKPISSEATVETKEVTPKEDTCTYSGSTNKDKTYASNNVLYVSTGNADNGYMRYAYFQFDLAEIPAGAESYKLVMTGYDYNVNLRGGKVTADVTYDTLDLTTLTYSNTPTNLTWANATTFTMPRKLVEGEECTEGEWKNSNSKLCTIMSFDVTDAVNAAKTQGKTTVTFRLSPASNGLMIYSKESTDANNKQKPAILYEVSVDGTTVDKNNLSFLLDQAGKVKEDSTKFLNYNADALKEAVDTGNAVVTNDKATQEQVNDAEDALMRILLGLRVVPAGQ